MIKTFLCIYNYIYIYSNVYTYIYMHINIFMISTLAPNTQVRANLVHTMRKMFSVTPRAMMVLPPELRDWRVGDQ